MKALGMYVFAFLKSRMIKSVLVSCPETETGNRRKEPANMFLLSAKGENLRSSTDEDY